MLRQPAAHSDGDSIVFFRASDVIAAGAVLDATRFPIIDVERGGSVQGEIDALNRVIELSVRPIPFVFEGGGTYIIPGHGRVYDQSDAVEYRGRWAGRTLAPRLHRFEIPVWTHHGEALPAGRVNPKECS